VLAAYGEVIVAQRIATITRASALERWWTRLTGDLDFMELCEFSFSDELDNHTPTQNARARQAEGVAA
jgi:hypothetical protein